MWELTEGYWNKYSANTYLIKNKLASKLHVGSTSFPSLHLLPNHSIHEMQRPWSTIDPLLGFSSSEHRQSVPSRMQRAKLAVWRCLLFGMILSPFGYGYNIGAIWGHIRSPGISREKQMEILIALQTIIFVRLSYKVGKGNQFDSMYN